MAINTHLISGLARWAKIVGEPVPGYQNGPSEWTFDVVLDAENEKKLLKIGVAKQYIKETPEGEKYVRFVRKAVKADGTPGKPIKIVDHKGQDWGNKLIGNGSALNVAFTLNTVGTGKTARRKPSILSVQVWNLESYKPKSSFPTRADTPKDIEEWSSDPEADHAE